VAPEMPSSVISVGDQAARRTWKIEIYQGDQREVQELDWPEELEATGDVKKSPEKATRPWTNPLMKFFGRRQKSDAETPVDADAKPRREKESEAESTEAGSNVEKTTKNIEDSSKSIDEK
jgi:hypothetical protein